MRCLILGLAICVFVSQAAESFEKFRGLTYSPYSSSGSCKEKATIHKDLFLLTNYTESIRLYAQDCDQTQAVLDYCKSQSGIRFLLGIWVRDNRFESELQTLSKIITQDSELFSRCVSGIIVGNEETMNASVGETQLIEYIQKTKEVVAGSGLDVKVLTSEIPKQWTENLIQAVDQIGVNIQPYFGYNNNNMMGASNDAMQQFSSMKDKADKPVIITEIGWPSNGANEYGAIPSLKSQNQFVKNVFCQCSQSKINYYIFEAFDSNWKKNEKLVEKSFGIFSDSGKISQKVELPPYACN